MVRRRSRSRGGSNPISRRAALGLLVVGGFGATVGAQQSGAFSGVAGQRGFNLGAASDENARLGITSLDPSVSGTKAVDILELHNRTGATLDEIVVDVLDSGSTSVDIQTVPNQLRPGESGFVKALVTCDSGGIVTVNLAIEAAGDGESITAERSVDIDCTDICVERIEETSVDYGLGGNDTEECAVEIRADEDAKVDLRGTSKIEGYLYVNAGGPITLDMVGDSVIGGDVTLETDYEPDDPDDNSGGGPPGDSEDYAVKVDLRGNVTIEGDLTITASGDIVVNGEENVEGEISINDEDQS